MFEIRGKYNTAKVFTDNVEETAIGQIMNLCNQSFVEGSNIRIMPDTHAGAGCTIGTTMTLTDKVVPNLVGVDIACGMTLVNLGKIDLNLEKLDNFIRGNIPAGHDVNDKEADFEMINQLRTLRFINKNRALCSIGSLGGGNHFIEVNVNSENEKFLVVHSGSRYLGKQVAEHYQDRAAKEMTDIEPIIKEIVERLKAQGRQNLIQSEIYKVKKIDVNKSLAYLEGNSFDDYIHDMKIIQEYATENRDTILRRIVKDFLGLKNGFGDCVYKFQTLHNYIDTKTMILRKGAISAQKDEIVLIPMNMRDGSLLCRGKGNLDWNCSAPHGAGRLMSRSKAKEMVSLEEYKKSMEGIFTTSVDVSTIDESPMAYKPMEEIMENVKDTVDILNVIKPVYNFKAGE